jgi:integrase/recombinase XerD
MSDPFSDLLFAFKEHLKVKNYSPMSIAAYTQQLVGFFDYLKKKDIIDIKGVTREILKGYQLQITEYRDQGGKGYTIATLAVKIRAVRRFFAYLEETNQILINPADHLKEPPQQKRLPRVVLTEEETRKILDQPNLSTMIGIRDRTILEVFYSTGIRLEEMVNLTIYDCDLQGGLLRVNKGKFAKDRVVPLGKHAVRFLKEYITRVRPDHTKSNKALRTLFVNQMGEPLSKQMIEIMVRDYAKEAGIQKKVTPHVFRHTFATELVRNGADISAVQKMLGHSSLKVTQIYTRVAGIEVKKTHGKHHPREKEKALKEETVPHIESIRGPWDR